MIGSVTPDACRPGAVRRHRARVSRHGVGGGVGRSRRDQCLSQFRDVVAARHRASSADRDRRTRELNFTNEGGVCGTTRLLKNIGGLWLLQSCRRTWARAGRTYGYDELLTAASQQAPAFTSLFDPDHRGFLHPDDMASAIAHYCRQTGQAEPGDPGGYVRAILESLAFKYRRVLDSLEEVTGTRFDADPDRRGRIAQPAAESVHRQRHRAHRRRRPRRGDGARQHRHADAGDRRRSSLGEARAVIDRSFPVERFEPSTRTTGMRTIGGFTRRWG